MAVNPKMLFSECWILLCVFNNISSQDVRILDENWPDVLKSHTDSKYHNSYHNKKPVNFTPPLVRDSAQILERRSFKEKLVNDLPVIAISIYGVKKSVQPLQREDNSRLCKAKQKLIFILVNVQINV